jgi:hypothetical protein
MEILIVIIVVAIFVAVFVKKGNFKREVKEEKLPYHKKDYLITKAESNFFKVLENTVGSDYYIFPQIILSNLFFIKTKEGDYRKYYNKINKKSVDFVLVGKEDMKPKLAIELDDSSHNYNGRKKRDAFVEKIFKDAEMPLLRIRGRTSYDYEKVKELVDNAISKKY